MGNCFTKSTTKTDDSSVCAICLDLLNQTITKMESNSTAANYNLIRTNCGHIFHVECLSSWIKQKRKCPLCRSFLTVLIDVLPNLEPDNGTQTPILDLVHDYLDGRTLSELTLDELLHLRQQVDQIGVPNRIVEPAESDVEEERSPLVNYTSFRMEMSRDDDEAEVEEENALTGTMPTDDVDDGLTANDQQTARKPYRTIG